VTGGTPFTTVTLTFASPKQGTKATGGATITGTITSDAGDNTTVDLGGLANGQPYTIGLSANFGGASDVVYEDVSNVKPAASPIAAKVKGQRKPKVRARARGPIA